VKAACCSKWKRQADNVDETRDVYWHAWATLEQGPVVVLNYTNTK